MKKRRRNSKGDDRESPLPPENENDNGNEPPKKDPKRTAFAVSFFGIIFGSVVFLMGELKPIVQCL
jgi:hypothetical protein